MHVKEPPRTASVRPAADRTKAVRMGSFNYMHIKMSRLSVIKSTDPRLFSARGPLEGIVFVRIQLVYFFNVRELWYRQLRNMYLSSKWFYRVAKKRQQVTTKMIY